MNSQFNIFINFIFICKQKFKVLQMNKQYNHNSNDVRYRAGKIMNRNQFQKRSQITKTRPAHPYPDRKPIYQDDAGLRNSVSPYRASF